MLPGIAGAGEILLRTIRKATGFSGEGVCDRETVDKGRLSGGSVRRLGLQSPGCTSPTQLPGSPARCSAGRKSALDQRSRPA